MKNSVDLKYFQSDFNKETFARKCNTKVKIYRDNSCTVTYSDTRVFKSPYEFEGFKNLQEFNEACKKDDTLAFVPRFIPQHTKEFRKTQRQERKNDESYQERVRSDSMKRAIDKVYDITFQNDWDYFITCTISLDNDFNRENPQEVYKKLRNWLNNNQKRKCLRYLIIAEYHHDSNGIHLHGLINNVLPLSDSGRVLYKGQAWKRADVERRGHNADDYKTIYNLDSWKYGFSTAIKVDGNPARLAHYITKYITKDTKKIFGKYYLSSRDCVRDCEIIVMNTNGFDECLQPAVKHHGVSFKYQSDFCYDDDSGRNPTQEILDYLAEREVSIFEKD